MISKSNDRNNQKARYVTPSLSIMEVEMEQGIAAGSANVNPGGTGNPNDVGSDDWDDGGNIGGGGSGFGL